MSDKSKIIGRSNWVVTLAALVIVIAGMKAAHSLLVPFLLSLFIAIICTPFLVWFRKKGIPNFLAILIVFLGILVVGLLFATIIGSSISSFSENLPKYQESLTLKMSELFAWLRSIGIDISDDKIKSSFNPGSIMNIAASTLTGLSGMLSNIFVIILIVAFMLFEAASFPEKLVAALGNPQGSIKKLGKITESINHYMAIKTIFSLSTGILIALWLWFLGIDYPILWGMLAFLLNFIPNIGSIIAAIPAVLFAIIQLGLGSAVLAAIGYLVVNTVAGSILEPRVMGRGLGLSTLIVFVSLIFWGWVLGPVGMILSVPLTVILKVALENDEDKRWIAILLSSSPPAK